MIGEMGSRDYQRYDRIRMMHTPITTPNIMESRLRRDLIMETTLFMPGIVSGRTCQQQVHWQVFSSSLITLIIRVLIPARDERWLANSERVSYACLKLYVNNKHSVHEETNSIMSSVMRCEPSILPLSARRESAADDL